jgi:hypothetical protein
MAEVVIPTPVATGPRRIVCVHCRVTFRFGDDEVMRTSGLTPASVTCSTLCPACNRRCMWTETQLPPTPETPA